MTQGGKQNETRNLQSKAFFRKLERLDLIEEAKMKDSGLMKSAGTRRGPSMRASGSVFVDARISG